MAGKVQTMLDLATRFTGLQIRIFSGLVPGNVTRLLVAPEEDIGTVIRAEA